MPTIITKDTLNGTERNQYQCLDNYKGLQGWFIQFYDVERLWDDRKIDWNVIRKYFIQAEALASFPRNVFIYCKSEHDRMELVRFLQAIESNV